MHYNRCMSLSVCSWSVSENAHNSCTTWYIFIQLRIILQEMTNLLSTHSFWHRILINLHSPWVMHNTVSWFLFMPLHATDIYLFLQGWVFNVVPWVVTIPSSIFGGWLADNMISNGKIFHITILFLSPNGLHEAKYSLFISLCEK